MSLRDHAAPELPSEPGDAGVPLSDPVVPRLDPVTDPQAISSGTATELSAALAVGAPAPGQRRRATRSDGASSGPRPRSRPLPPEPPLAPVALRVDPNPPLYTEK